MTSGVATDPLSRLTGVSLDEFARSNWGTVPLLTRAARLSPGDFTDLFSLSDVDELIAQRGLRTPFIRMTRDGNVLPTARFTSAGGAGAEIRDQVADDRVLAEFAAGATIVLQALHRTWPRIRAFASALVAQLGHPVQVNAYITPPQNTGFSAHYDVHDVFVMQFAGRKHWRVHEPVFEVPLRDQPWDDRRKEVAARATESPALDVVLECGDTLYLPRGYIHSATSLGEVSGHLTFGVHPLTRRLLAQRIFDSLADEVELRRALPLGVDLGSEAALADEIESTLDLVREALVKIDRAEIARGIGRHLSDQTRPAPLRPLEQLASAAALLPSQTVRARPGLRATVAAYGGEFAIVLPDRRVRIEAGEAEAARIATSGTAVAAGDLPGLDSAGAVAFLARLLREGIVVPA